MAIAPSLISGTAFIRSETLIQNQERLADLNRQLATGERATTYGELGSTRGQSVSVRADIARLEAFQSTIDRLNVRVDLTVLSLERLEAIRSEARDAIDPNSFVDLGNGNTFTRQSANLFFTESIALLNSQADDRFIFGGNDVLNAPVEAADVILEGDATRDGLRQITEERLAADLGVSGLGRLTVDSTGSTVTIAEDSISDFGFDIAGVASGLTGVTPNLTLGEPANIALDFTGQPAAGEVLTIFLDLPDGTQTTLELTANGPANQRDSFAIGPDVATTQANFEAALTETLRFAALSDLTAVSRLQSAENFFNTEGGRVPQRIDTSLGPAETATGFIDATEADTVFFYNGQNDANPPREGLTARVDGAITVDYGLRANEEAFREGLASLAAFAIGDFTTGATESENQAIHAALASRVSEELASQVDAPSIQSVTQEIAGVSIVAGNAQARNENLLNTLEGVREDIERADPTEVALELLTLQTQIEASFEATSRVSSLTLLNFLP